MDHRLLTHDEDCRVAGESNRQSLMDGLDGADDAAFGEVGGVIDGRVDESFIRGHLLHAALTGSVVRDPPLDKLGTP